jgi:hypothetical protein
MSLRVSVGALCWAALLLVACSAAPEPANTALSSAPGDISGTWIVSTPVLAMKTVAGTTPPLNTATLALYNGRLAAAQNGDRSWDPSAKCKPPGEPRTLVEMAWPFEVMQSPKRIDFLFQWNRLARSIAIGDDQTNVQKLDGLAPFYFGQTVGHWEGDTLVVTVIAVRDTTFLDPSGLPHSDDMVLTERFRIIDGGATLEARLHIDDAANYSSPWDAVLTFKRMPAGTRIAEDVCIERLKLNDYATLENSLK